MQFVLLCVYRHGLLIISLQHKLSDKLRLMCEISTAKAKLTSITAGRVQQGQDSLDLSQAFGLKCMVRRRVSSNMLWHCMGGHSVPQWCRLRNYSLSALVTDVAYVGTIAVLLDLLGELRGPISNVPEQMWLHLHIPGQRCRCLYRASNTAVSEQP